MDLLLQLDDRRQAALKKIARRRKMTPSRLIEQAVDEFIERLDDEELLGLKIHYIKFVEGAQRILTRKYMASTEPAATAICRSVSHVGLALVRSLSSNRRPTQRTAARHSPVFESKDAALTNALVPDCTVYPSVFR